MSKIAIVLFFVAFISCTPKKEKQFVDRHKQSNILFENNLDYTEEVNPYTFRNFYNGGGVAIGDINNDGLNDIYFTGNQVDNKLFLNKGNWVFEDITSAAGVACSGVWSTGVTFVDINADGLLDIYVCKSGPPGGDRRYNELFINNGDLTFTEQSKKYGLDVTGLSVQSAFFDFDRDGDLDCYLLTNSIRSVGNYDLVEGLREKVDTVGGNKFLINNNGVFEDYINESGIYSSAIGFGLGITLSDFNVDGWTDMYISNDFFEKDYLYINNQNGGFDEQLEQTFSSISMGSMGADMADLDNDGHMEIMVTEMLPDSLSRVKNKAVFENWDKYRINVSKGYYHQFPRNTLQKNLGNGSFLEIGRFSGVAATEWSWGTLLFDMDNDGLKDIFVSNGIYKDLLDRDYLNYTATDDVIREMINNKENVIENLVDQMPSSAQPNYMYKNNGSFSFSNVAPQIGLGQPSFTNGSAYGDLDNDGDLDLVVNNVNMPSFVYENNVDTLQHRSLVIQLHANEPNTFQIGAKITLKTNGKQFVAENYVARGFQSGTPPEIHIGVGALTKIDTVQIQWPDGTTSFMKDVNTNQILKIAKGDLEVMRPEQKISPKPLFQKVEVIKSKHIENNLVDFNRERLLTSMFSNEGPQLAVGDLNGDGSDDLVVGGAKGSAAQLYLWSDTSFIKKAQPLLEKHAISEDVDNIFIDIDNDNDLDLYISSGGKGVSKSSSALKDRLYLNNGANEFDKEVSLPFRTYFSSSTVKPSDFDKDGDLDLFVGERFHPFFYGTGGAGYLLKNDGNAKFEEISTSITGFDKLGMVKDAVWLDVNNDEWDDLIIVGDWMGIKLFINQQGTLVDQSDQYNLSGTVGLWNTIETGDFNGDGTMDFVVGNLGRNSFITEEHVMYVHDFDGNGAIEQIICKSISGKYYPIHDRDELIAQLPALKKKLLFYADYSKMSIDQIIDAKTLEKAAFFDLNMVETSLFINRNTKFEKVPLPPEIQYAPVYAIMAKDMNNDGMDDLFFGGNQFNVKPQFGRYDASEGWYLPLKKELNFGEITSMGVKGQIRDIKFVNLSGNRELIVFAINNDEVQVYEIQN